MAQTPNKVNRNSGRKRKSKNEFYEDMEDFEGDPFVDDVPDPTKLEADKDTISDRYMYKVADTYGPVDEKKVCQAFRHIEKHPEDRAKVFDLLYRHNDRWIIKVAARYKAPGFTTNDLMQIARMGFLRGCEKFDFRRGYTLSTYTTFWIKEALGRNINTLSRMIKLPTQERKDFIKVQKAWAKGWAEQQRALTTEELSKETGLSIFVVDQYKQLFFEFASLEKELSEGGATLGDTVADTHTRGPETNIELEFDLKLIRDAVNTLSPADAQFIQRYWGLNETKERTVDQMCELYKCKKADIEARFDALRDILKTRIPCHLFSYFSVDGYQTEHEPVPVKIQEKKEPLEVKPVFRTDKLFYWWNPENGDLLLKLDKGLGDVRLGSVEMVIPWVLASDIISKKHKSGKVRLTESGKWEKYELKL